MKKYMPFLKWFTAAMAISTTAVVLGVGLVSCSSTESFNADSYSTTSSKVEKLNIEVENRDITIVGTADEQVKIDYFYNEKEFYNISLSETKELTLKLTYNYEWTDYIGTKASAEYRKILIAMPLNILTDLTVSTTNGKISTSSINISNSVTLTSNGGNVEFSQINPGNNIILNTKNGDINGSIIGSYDMFAIFCEIKKGECNLPLKKETGTKVLNASCNNGNINIDFQNI